MDSFMNALKIQLTVMDAARIKIKNCQDINIEKTRKSMIMKIFILCISLVFGIFAIVVYAKGLKHRIKELTDRSDEKKLWSNKQDDITTFLSSLNCRCCR
jgi:hypothetical protein